MIQTGTVIKSTGSWYQVLPDGENAVPLECRIIGKFRLDDMPLTNPVGVGDRVEITTDTKLGGTVIKKILPRRNYVVRQSPRRKHDLHLLAANIDQAVLLTTIAFPDIKPGFIDRFLIMVAKFETPVTIVFNKADLYTEEHLETYAYYDEVYRKIGYDTLLTSSTESRGLDAFRDLLQGKTSLLSGQSGVGKSSLVNAIQTHLDLRTGEISDYSGKGQHTTTFAEMFPLDFGGSIIDTPGVKMLSFNDKDKLNIAHSYKEMFRFSENCRFGGSCLHRNEPGCAVKDAVEAGEISPMRYASYLGILDEVDDQNYWERYKEI